LSEIVANLGTDRRVCVAREISKFYEEFVRGTVTEVHAHFEKTEPKGEIVVVIEGAPKEEKVKRNKYKED
jgi:16S rRNA (cytidine1402-2'-O)-methyltransferase